MESMLELFDPTDQKKILSKGAYSSTEKKSEHDSNIRDHEERLPPESEQGNVEYKLKLVDPSSQRFEHLVTQMKWRLREGHGEAIYQIGM